MRTFLPRSDERLNSLPSRSGSVSSGASAETSVREPMDSGPSAPHTGCLVRDQGESHVCAQRCNIHRFALGRRSERYTNLPLAGTFGLQFPTGSGFEDLAINSE